MWRLVPGRCSPITSVKSIVIIMQKLSQHGYTRMKIIWLIVMMLIMLLYMILMHWV